MPLISAGTKIMLEEEELKFCSSVPSLGATPSEVEVTSLQDTAKTTIAGIKEYDSLEFEFFYDTEQFAKLHPLADGKTNRTITVEFTDGLKVVIKGAVSLALGSVAVNEALTYTLTISLSEDMTYTLPEQA